MSPAPSQSISNALSRDSRVVLSNHAGGFLRVASVTATTIVVDSVAPLTDITLFAASTPGIVIVKEGVVAGDEGKTANVTGIAGTTLTVDVDLTTALADGDIIFVAPPQAIELATNGGITLDVTAANEVTKGLTESFITHNTPNGVEVGGDVPFFTPAASHGLARLLAVGIGGYDKSGTGIHDFAPYISDPVTFADSSYATVYAKDGNATLEQIYTGLFATSMTITFPERGLATASMSLTGNAYAREIGGTGKNFPAGASAYVVSGLDCDTGSRHNFNGVFVEFGGAFGAALTDARETTVTNATISVSREVTQATPLGNAYMTRASEVGHELEITMTRILEDNARHDEFMGGGIDPQGSKTETRVLLKAVHPSIASRTLEFDIPRAVIDAAPVTRQRGHFVQELTIRAIHTLDADGCPDAANPLYRARYNNGIDVDVLTSLLNA